MGVSTLDAGEYWVDFYQLLFEKAQDAILLVGRDGRIVDANPATERIYGYSISELKSMEIFELYPEGEDALDKGAFQDIIRKASSGILFDAVNRRKDGKRINVEYNCKGIVYDHQKMGLNIVRDITVRKKIEMELKRYQNHLEEMVKLRTAELEKANLKLKNEVRKRIKNEEKLSRLAAIVESTDAAVIGLDPQGKILSWNKAAERLYGYEQEEILGQPISLLAPANLASEVEDNISRLIKGEKFTRFETIRKRKDSSFINVSLTISPIREADVTTGISVIARDITDRRRLELEMARLERLNMIGEMAAGISHEVRNPMTTVRGFLQRLGEKEDCQAYKDYFEIMIEEIDRANQILTEFLSIGKNKVAGLSLQNLNSILEAMFPLIEADAMGQDKWIKMNLQEVPNVYLDEKEIRQVILNLVRNGLDAMEPGGALYLKTYGEADCVVLVIEDEGSGISPEVLDKLGTPFFTTKEQGTGLGMAISYGIIARHKGKIDVISSPTGTRVTIQFQCPTHTEKGNSAHLSNV